MRRKQTALALTVTEVILYIASTEDVLPLTTSTFRKQPPLPTFGPFLLLSRQACTQALDATLSSFQHWLKAALIAL